jgi:magnesium chelatase family protein
MFDRFDLAVHVKRVAGSEYQGDGGESTGAVAERVVAAREVQHARGCLNRDLSDRDLSRLSVSEPGEALLIRSLESGAVTARGTGRIRRVAQTLADLEGISAGEEHVAEALSLRGSW